MCHRATGSYSDGLLRAEARVNVARLCGTTEVVLFYRTGSTRLSEYLLLELAKISGTALQFHDGRRSLDFILRGVGNRESIDLAHLVDEIV